MTMVEKEPSDIFAQSLYNNFLVMFSTRREVDVVPVDGSATVQMK